MLVFDEFLFKILTTAVNVALQPSDFVSPVLTTFCTLSFSDHSYTCGVIFSWPRAAGGQRNWPNFSNSLKLLTTFCIFVIFWKRKTHLNQKKTIALERTNFLNFLSFCQLLSTVEHFCNFLHSFDTFGVVFGWPRAAGGQHNNLNFSDF